MPSELIVTSDWLTTTLRNHGHLATGAVTTVGTDTFDTPPSVLTRLAVDYTVDALGGRLHCGRTRRRPTPTVTKNAQAPQGPALSARGAFL